MSQFLRRIVLLQPTIVTTSTAFQDINLPQGFSSATLTVTATTVTGTSPTFNVFIQQQLPQAASTDLTSNPPSGTAIYDDVLSFNTVSTNGTTVAKLGTQYIPTSTAGNNTNTGASWTQSDAALTANTLRLGPIGGDWRVKMVVAGTSPSATIAVVGEFLPYGG